MYGHTASAGKPLTVRNANYKADIQYATSISKYILISIGIWPAVSQGVGRFLPTILFVLCNLAMCFTIIPCVLYVIYDDADVILKVKVSGALSFAITACFKHFALAFRRSAIVQCMKQVEEDWKLVECRLDRETMLKHGRVGRNLTITCACFMYCGGLIYDAFMPVMVNENNHFNDYNRTTRHLVYPSYGGFFESQKSPVFQLVYAVHVLCEYIMFSATAGGCTLAAIFVTHTCGQIEILISRLKDLVDGEIFKDSSNVGVRFKIIVQRHLRVLGFAGTTGRILQEVCLVEFLDSIFMICLLEYYCIVDWKAGNIKGLMTYVLLLISVSFNIFIFCHIGELLMEKTSYIREACYVIDWYRLPIETSRGFILMMAVSCNPAKISAGGMVNLSISTFGHVLKTSLVYLNFIQTVVFS